MEWAFTKVDARMVSSWCPPVCLPWEQEYTTVPIFPHAHLQLQFPQGTVTYKLKRALRIGRTTPALEKVLKENYEWEDAAFSDVNWEAMRLALIT